MAGVNTRIRAVTAGAAGLAVGAGLWLPAVAAQAATAQVSAYAPSANEWWLANWQVQQEVWPLSEGAGVTVAVVDGGVQASVPDLRGAVVQGGDMLGDPGDGETDFNTAEHGHGTAVAVVIAGQGYGTGTIGIAPQAKILPVHVLTPPDVGTSETIAAGIRYAVNHGASVINLSIGIPVPSAAYCDPDLQAAVSFALVHNVVVVAGSGDVSLTGPGPVEPASCAGVLTAGGVEPNGSLWSGSTQQPYVMVAAPGDHMVYVEQDGRYTTTGWGTSLSSPLVAGAAALIRSRYPRMPWYQVDQRLTATAIPEGASVPNDGYGYGYGIIDPARAVDASAYPVAASAPDPVYAKFRAWLATPAGISFARANGMAAGAAASPGTGAGGVASSIPAVPGTSTSGVSAGQVLEGVGALIAIAVLAVFGVRAMNGRNRAITRAGLAYGRAARGGRGQPQQQWDFPPPGHGGPPGVPGSPLDAAPRAYPPAGYPPPAGSSPAGYPPAGYGPAGQPPTPEHPADAAPPPPWWQQDDTPPGR